MDRADPILPVEEIYTDVDVNRSTNIDKNLGFTFNYPRIWLDSHSNSKMIGVRRLKIIPTSNLFKLGLRVYEESPDISNVEWDEWESVTAKRNYLSKPADWHYGVWISQPTYTGYTPGEDQLAGDEDITTEDNTEYLFKWETLNIMGEAVGYICTADARMTRYRFTCTIDEGNPNGRYVMSIDKSVSN